MRTPAGLTLAALLIIAAAFVGWLVVRATAVEMLSGPSVRAGAIVAGQPTVALGTAMGGFVANRGSIPRQALPSVRAAAAQLPLDARPYLFIGSDYLRAGKSDLAAKTFEAGRRLDPRQRWIHILLLDHYLRAGRYPEAADEFAVLSRLVGGAQGPIATALAQMTIAPQTRDAARLTLRQDVGLERAVLTSLASTGVEPAVIFGMASPAALATANLPGSWGGVLIDRLVSKQRYRLAHSVWQRINRLNDRQVGSLIYDLGLQGLPGKPPFNWMTVSNNVAAVDMQSGKFEVNYYGRDNGNLITQLLLLPPGTYRFGFFVSGVQQGAEPVMVWAFTCENQPDRTIASIPVPLTNARSRRVAATVTVPAGCPAQRLRLSGLAGEFPQPVTATIERLQLEKATAS